MPQELRSLLNGDKGWDRFSLTYDDLHPLHGGLLLAVHGSGKVAQRADRMKVGTPRVVERENLRTLVRLLLDLEAWEQVTPERAPGHDESRARLIIRAGAVEAGTWEWFNDLEKGQRILRVREAMKVAAWEKLPD